MLKLLVPVDGSSHSDRVIDFAIRKKDWYKDSVELHVLNVQPAMPYGSSVTAAIGQDAVNKYHREEAMKVLTPVMQKLDAAGVTYKHHICVGDPGELIAEFAKEQGCDQIIMGTRGAGAAAALLLGSTVTKVIHLSTVPVLLVK
jgi:nucleotide-binding universal stress UspA family protein